VKICVYCGSSGAAAPVYREAARDLGLAIGRAGHALVFGGFDQGLMGAVAHGTHDAGGEVFGVVPASVDYFKMRSAQVFPCDEEIEVADLAARKAMMEEISDAFIALPGSFGTLDEYYNVLAQGKIRTTCKPIALLNVNGFYDSLALLHRRMVDDGFMGAAELESAHLSADSSDAIRYVEERAAASGL
jgi:uncharacterized protein (TIGR00730 family)